MRGMLRSVRLVLAVAAAGASVSLLGACGAGQGNVYIGVGVVGPYWGYPGYYPPPTMIGRPPVYWEDEDQEEDVEDSDAEEVHDAEVQDVVEGAQGTF